MIAIGAQYVQMAALTAPRVEYYTGLPVEVVLEGEPFEQKLGLLRGAKKPVLYIDTDAVLIGWDWRPFKLDKFNAVQDPMAGDWPGKQPIMQLLLKPWAINTGVWLAPPACAEMFDLALELKRGRLRDFEYALGDQTAVNLALQGKNTPMHFLHWKFNKLLFPNPSPKPPIPRDALVVHLVGGGAHHRGQSESELDERLRRVEELCERYPLP